MPVLFVVGPLSHPYDSRSAELGAGCRPGFAGPVSPAKAKARFRPLGAGMIGS